MESLSKAKRIGVMGGSFDPVHIGHLIIAQDAAERLEFSEVVFIPAAVPPHKKSLERAAAEHRLNMLRLAVESDIGFSVSDIELQRGGLSYTIDTVRTLKEERPDVEWVLVIGSDTLLDLHNWYKIDELLELCEVATFLRPGDQDLSGLMESVRLPQVCKDKLFSNLVESHLVEISSTEIRMRITEGLAIRYLVPAEVEMYIYEHGLYQG